MNQQHALCLLVACFMSVAALAQTTATVSGKVLDGANNEPLPYLTVTVLTTTDSTILTGALTDLDGRFSIAGMQPGSYVLRYSFVGYQGQLHELLIGEKNTIYDVGKIELLQNAEQLNELVIEGKKATESLELDKKTFTIEDNVAQSGGSVLDAMKSLPGVTTDQEGNVLLRGSDQVAITVDGKQNSLTGYGNQSGLDNIPAANIERIEIINNPSAKYDASGMAGVINIVYKKEKSTGWNGDIGVAAGLGELTTRKQDLPTELGRFSQNHKLIPSLNLGYRSKRVNVFLQSEVLNQRKLPNNEFTTRRYASGLETVSQVPENRKQTQYIAKAGADVYINDNNTLGFSTVFDYESHIDRAQIPYIDLATNQRYRYWFWQEEEVTGYLNFQLDYLHKFKQPGHELSASAQYTRGWEDESYFLNDSSQFREASDTTHIVAIENTSTVNLDYVRPLKRGRLESGAKLRFRTLPVTYTIGRGTESVIAPGLGEWSDWGETIYAGYLNYIYERKKYDVEAGFRAEQTDVFYTIDPANIYYAENDAYDYFRLYPNVRVTMKLAKRHRLSLFYNNRVDRPGEPNLRIFPKYDDPELLKVGNPYVRPQFTQTFEAAYKHTWNTGSVFLAGYHRIIDDPFMRVYAIDTSTAYTVLNKIYQNFGSGSQTGSELLLAQQLGKKWDLSASANVYSNTVDGHTGTLLYPYERSFTVEKSTELTWDSKLNVQWKAGKETNIQATAVYLAPKNIAQGRQLARASLDLGIKRKFAKEKGVLTLSATDIFNTFGLRQEIESDGFTALYENYYETQVVRLGVRYKIR